MATLVSAGYHSYLTPYSRVDRLSGKKSEIPEQFSPVPIRVLSASNDDGLNSARAMLLRDHGFDVITSENVEHAIREIKQRELDILIFGSTVPRDNCWTLAEVFRQRHSNGKVIEILPSPWAAPKNRPDAVVVSSDEPEELVAAILKARA